MEIILQVPRHAAWTPTEKASFHDHLEIIYGTIAEDAEDDYSLRIQVFTDAERRQQQVWHNLRFEPFALCEDQNTSTAYGEHWFVIPAYRGTELVSSEADWDLVHLRRA